MNKREGRLSIGEKLCFTGIFFGNNVASQLLLYFAMFFFTDVAHINPAVAGLIFLLNKIWDAVNDPMAGVLIDKTQSSKGKARPWLLYTAIPTMIFLVLTFSTPNFSDTGRVIWCAVSYVGISMCMTLTVISSYTLMARVSHDDDERMTISVFGNVGGALAGVATSAACMPLVNLLGKGNMAAGFRYMSIVFAVIVGALLILCTSRLKELPATEEDRVKAHETKVGDLLRSAIRNDQFILFAGLLLFSGTAMGMYSGSLMYYLKYNLGRPELSSYATPILMACMFIGMLLVKPISKKVEPKKLFIIAELMGATAMLVRFITRDAYIPVLFAMFALMGLSAAFLNVLIQPMIMDTMKYGELKTGVKTEGLLMSGASFMNKMGAGIGGGLLGAFLAGNGYVANAASQTPEALHAIFLAQIIFFMVAQALIAVIMLGGYKLNRKKMAEINQQLNEKAPTATSGEAI